MNLSLFDAHCDTVQKLRDFGGELRSNPYQVDLLRLINRKCGSIQVFAAFIDKESDRITPFKRCNQLIDKYFTECKKNTDLMQHCQCTGDIEDALIEQKVAALLAVEGGEALEGNVENLHFFYNRGVRVLTLCWNYKNELASGISEADGGLTAFGRRVIDEMNRLGMLIDVSHISEKGFWDVAEYCNLPIAATHSNAKTLKNHPRNLTDSQIKAIISKNGCIGINLYSEFVSSGKCKISDAVRHIEHIMELGGENSIGIGCDFDGADSFPQGICGAEDLEKLIEELFRLGYSEAQVTKIASGNFLRLFKEIIG